MEIVERTKTIKFEKLDIEKAFITEKNKGFLYIKITLYPDSKNTLGFDISSNQNFICTFNESDEVIPVEILRLEYQRK